MVISNNLIKLLNYRIEQEEYSSRLYKSMSIWLDFNGFVGAAKLWNEYSEEEIEHAQWTYRYLLDLNVKPEVQPIKQPENVFKSFPNVIALSYKHEVEIMEQCQELARVAQSEGDYMTLEFAQKYLREQVDELGKTQQLLDQLDAFGSDKIALRFLDNWVYDNLLSE